ncbi:FAD-dependent oxidoreductase [Vibrio breoganii]|uniref:FAD-dependent oxidoreductase n=1 Tax=Vibrio breoganii TaxID=553239 RepID=UPI000C84CC9D|nr:FAD-dependent oxidoreductase [Vibrio breoganii]PMH22269.1 oxidoreductase [Vibrio breoganii]PMM11718.1 oxidoreductase [Vibrio breoganii]TKG17342.1 FAD-dependent oxidoreductase [Vibrio breoganii]
MAEQGQTSLRVAVIGGGIAGSTAALHLAEQGIEVTLIEQSDGLVNGPPICHLHAGGNLYREISQQQCVDLLKQSIETVRLFPNAVNARPTVIATPLTDSSDPLSLLPRLSVIQESYQYLVEQDPLNCVLGKPEHYYSQYSRARLEALRESEQPQNPSSHDDWMIPFAQHVDLDNLKYPVLVVQEFGLSVFRLAASVTLTLEHHPKAQLMTGCRLEDARYVNNQWHLTYQPKQGDKKQLVVDYLVNSTGYKTGTIDDLTNQSQKRLVEFKSAFITHWENSGIHWPEVIFHGERGTPQGMAQLTPYSNGYFQVHGMTESITLFDKGLVASEEPSSQPRLPLELEAKITHGWPESAIQQRTQNAIGHMSQHIPTFTKATVGGKPLFGAQQIPGDDPRLRVADVSFTENNYARIELVKASSAFQAARKIKDQLQGLHSFEQTPMASDISVEHAHPNLSALSPESIEVRAKQLARDRGYPEALAIQTGTLSNS